MKYVIVSLVAVVCLLSSVFLCRTECPQPALLPSVIVEPLDPTLEGEAAAQWRLEVQRRFPRAVVVIVHGGDYVRGEWTVKSSYNHAEHADVVARRFKELYPDRVVVFVSCNPGHYHLGVPGVYYALDSVWVHPDRNEGPHAAEVNDPEVIGNIFEFVKDD